VKRLGDRVAVRDLMVGDPGQGAADHVAGHVAAGSDRRDPRLLVALEDVRHVLEPDPVHLDALARGAVDDPARVLVGQVGEEIGLGPGEDALGDLRPEHEVPVAGVVGVEPVPFEPSGVVGVEGLPALLGRAHERVKDVEAVLVLLDLLGLVHARLDLARGEGLRARAPSSGAGGCGN
jgi:hypothetical protein